MKTKKKHSKDKRQHTGASPETSIMELLAVTAFVLPPKYPVWDDRLKLYRPHSEIVSK